MKNILLFGAGKSSTVLIDYLITHASEEQWYLTVVDANLELAQARVGNTPLAKAVSFDIRNVEERSLHISKSDIVISLLPPVLHLIVAKDCVQYKKNLLTASYVDEGMKALKPEIEANGLLFLCEMGLDPGIDHMSAKKMIDDIRSEEGVISAFHSHCGGLVAPESDDNPWHYKISWNPRNVVMAGKAGAIFKQYGQIVEWDYEELFAHKRFVSISDSNPLCWYPNRDSLSYISLYGLEESNTFIRTTLRHPDFMYGWKNLIELKLTDEKAVYDTDGISLSDFFKGHMDTHNFGPWLEQKLHEQFDSTKNLLQELLNLSKLEEEAAKKGVDQVQEFMVVDETGDLQQLDIEDLKINAASVLAEKMHDAKLTLKQLFFLGMDDNETMINKGICSAADVLQFALEKKLGLKKNDKDMVVMLHEVEFSKGGEKYKSVSSFVLEGMNDIHTAMAKTVGLPLGIATRLILNGTIKTKGLHIPIIKEIYEPVLNELEFHGIRFHEQTTGM
jgi:saccharopine dehydrogenase-like NADP-dependent oxidoreductase